MWVGGVPSVVTVHAFLCQLIEKFVIAFWSHAYYTFPYSRSRDLPSLHSAKFKVYALESREHVTISSWVWVTVRSLHLWLANSVSAVPSVVHVMLGGLTGQVQTKQAVTVMMPQHHHSGTGAPAQENSALIVWATGPPSMACLKALWSRPSLVLLPNPSFYLADLQAGQTSFIFISSLDGFFTLFCSVLGNSLSSRVWESFGGVSNVILSPYSEMMIIFDVVVHRTREWTYLDRFMVYWWTVWAWGRTPRVLLWQAAWFIGLSGAWALNQQLKEPEFCSLHAFEFRFFGFVTDVGVCRV